MYALNFSCLSLIEALMESIYELFDTTHRLFVCCVCKYMGILLWKIFFFFWVISNYFVVVVIRGSRNCPSLIFDEFLEFLAICL